MTMTNQQIEALAAEAIAHAEGDIDALALFIQTRLGDMAGVEISGDAAAMFWSGTEDFEDEVYCMATVCGYITFELNTLNEEAGA